MLEKLGIKTKGCPFMPEVQKRNGLKLSTVDCGQFSIQ